jgi:hypothetical protein
MVPPVPRKERVGRSEPEEAARGLAALLWAGDRTSREVRSSTMTPML